MFKKKEIVDRGRSRECEKRSDDNTNDIRAYQKNGGVSEEPLHTCTVESACIFVNGAASPETRISDIMKDKTYENYSTWSGPGSNGDVS